MVRDGNNVRKSLVDNFFFEKVFPVIIGVERKIILFTPMLDSKTAGFLNSESDGPFLKMNFIKFLYYIYEMILLDKLNTNCINRAKSC